MSRRFVRLRATFGFAAVLVVFAACRGDANPIGASEVGASVTLNIPLKLRAWSLSGNGMAADFAVYSNVQDEGAILPSISSQASRVAIVFHDASRAAGDNANDLMAALEKSATDPSVTDTLVLAPYFVMSPNDWPASERPKTPVFWPDDSYIEGGQATGGSAPSSYALIDAMLALVSDTARFPKVRYVTLIGHSAGGQTAQLYTMALGSNVRFGPIPLSWDFASVVANPSSYAYPDDKRPSGDGNVFAQANANGCSGVNAWKFGLSALPSPALAGTPNELGTAYAARKMGYLLGLDDNNPTDPTMDQGCEAEAQGPTRLRRGRSFYAHLTALFPKTTQTLCEVPNVGHDTAAMLASACAQNVLFRGAPSP